MQPGEIADRAEGSPFRGAFRPEMGASARDSATPPSFPHEAPTDPASLGLDPRRLRAAVKVLRDQHASGLFPGAQIAVRWGGQLVVDEAIGLAAGYLPEESASGPRLARPDTPFPVFSAGKPLIALAVALLEERGLLDVNAPIAETIPEFAARGKHSITTLDVLTHTGGILMPEFSRRWQDWGDWNKVVDAICAVTPSLPRGTLAYHPLEYGWVLSEVVRRVAGRTLPDLLEDEILRPAGLSGLRFRVPREMHGEVARSYWLGGPRAYVGPVNVAEMFREIGGTPEVLLGAYLPGAGLVTDAAHLAAFYDLLAAGGATRDGRRVLQAVTIRRYTDRYLYSWCRSNRVPLAVGRGFLVGTRAPSVYGWWGSAGCFGHAGAFCTVAFADRATDLSVAVVTNGNRSARDMARRFPGLLGKLRRAVKPRKAAVVV